MVPQVRNVIFSPIQVPKTNDDDDTEDNDDAINVPVLPDEPAAKGSVRVPQWSASAARPLRRSSVHQLPDEMPTAQTD